MGRTVAIIPARLGSTRFPGKVLANETGSPLLWHVHEAARGAETVARVVVATDSARVRDAMADLGAETVLTGEHPNGTSRLAEAARLLGLAEETVVVNVQGDEPEIEPGVIDECVRTLETAGLEMATIASPFAPGEDPADPHLVKVVFRRDGRALYFSRSPVPHGPAGEARPVHKHIGIYAYRRAFLDRYAALEPTPLELAERLEQLRVLEHGWDIGVGVRVAHHHGIDTPEQYAAFVARWRGRA